MRFCHIGDLIRTHHGIISVFQIGKLLEISDSYYFDERRKIHWSSSNCKKLRDRLKRTESVVEFSRELFNRIIDLLHLDEEKIAFEKYRHKGKDEYADPFGIELGLKKEMVLQICQEENLPKPRKRKQGKNPSKKKKRKK